MAREGTARREVRAEERLEKAACALCGMPRTTAGAAASADDPMRIRSQAEKLRRRLEEVEAGELHPGDVPASALCALCAKAMDGSDAPDQPLARRIAFAIERLDMEAGGAETSGKPTT